MSLQSLMNHSYDNYGKTDTRDAAAGMGRTPVLKKAGITARIQTRASGQQLWNGVLSDITDFVIFSTDSGTENGDTVVFVDPSDGKTVTGRITSSAARRAIGGMPTFFVYIGQGVFN